MGIFEAASDRFLGGCGLHRMDWNLGTFDSGYWLRSTAQGHGFMREAVTLLTRLAFDELKANRVQIRMDTRNLRSRRVAEEVGYHFEGTLRMSIPSSDGRPGDQHVFALTPEDYRNLNGVAWEG
jgi:RimJ/RimL family protein N-acetyltransferase